MRLQRAVTTKEERDKILYNRDYFWKGRGFCIDCNASKTRDSKSIRCVPCANKENARVRRLKNV